MKQETEIVDGVKVTKIIYEEIDLRSESEKTQITNICNVCDRFNDNACSECGCLINVLIGMKENHCPLEKW